MNEHHHDHDDHCTCGACGGHGVEQTHDQIPEAVFGDVHVESHLHDDAIVVSGRLMLRGDEGQVKAALQAQLGKMARVITSMGGIVGHIKASCETTTVDMFSVTDSEVMVKQTQDAVLRINLAVIVFAIDQQTAEELAQYLLNTVKASV